MKEIAEAYMFMTLTGLLAMIICISVQKEIVYSSMRMLHSLREGVQIFMKTFTITPDVQASYVIRALIFSPLRRGMQIYLKTLTAKTYMDAETPDTISMMLSLREDMLHRLRGGMQLPMKILAKTLTAKTIATDVQASDVIRALIVSPLLGGMQIFLTTLTAKTYMDVETSDMISMLPSLREGMQTFVKTTTCVVLCLVEDTHIWTLHGKTITLDSEALASAKIPCQRDDVTIWQRLTLVSKQLEDDLHLVLRLCGDVTISRHNLPGRIITVDVQTSEPCPVIASKTNVVPNPLIPSAIEH